MYFSVFTSCLRNYLCLWNLFLYFLTFLTTRTPQPLQTAAGASMVLNLQPRKQALIAVSCEHFRLEKHWSDVLWKPHVKWPGHVILSLLSNFLVLFINNFLFKVAQGSGQPKAVELTNSTLKRLVHRIMEYPGLEWTQKDHPVQLLTLHRPFNIFTASFGH